MRKALLIGGAGYVGTVMARYLLERGYGVKVVDNLIYEDRSGCDSLAETPGYEFFEKDFRDLSEEELLGGNYDLIVVLAGLVGDPITKLFPALSRDINLIGLSGLMNKCALLDDARIMFVSTCSNYGILGPGRIADETTDLNPLSLYAKAKCALESEILEIQKRSSACFTILRFATAFGLSSRMRFDLTVNEFVGWLSVDETLEVFDVDSWRPYCHVKDFAEIIRRVGDAPEKLVKGQVFNCGDDENNATKKMLIEKIQNHVSSGSVEVVQNSVDFRDYRVSFEKVRQVLDFSAQYSIDDGIEEIRDSFLDGVFTLDHLRSKRFGNYEIVDGYR